MTYTTEQIEELLSKRTPGKWEWDDPAIGDLCSNDFSDSVLYVTNHDKVGATPADKAFIAASPEIVRQQQNKITELEDDLLAALRILDVVRVTAWKKTEKQEFRCDMCGGVGSYPRSIEHHSKCDLKLVQLLVEKYKEELMSAGDKSE